MKTGLHDLDAAIDINGNKLIVLGSIPAMGKSNAMVEYTKFRRIKNPKILGEELTEEDWDRIEYGTRLLKTSKIFIEDKSNISIDEICIEAEKVKLQQNIQFIVIDYLQLIRYEGEEVLSRDLQINKILEKLKTLSEELNIPILVLSQLSRKPENRNEHRPRITDFSNSNKSIDMYLDIVLLLYRDEYYNYKTKQKNIAEIIIAKGTAEEMNIEIAWMPEYLKYGNLLRVK